MITFGLPPLAIIAAIMPTQVAMSPTVLSPAMRAMWRWVTWASSCAITAASSFSLRVATIRPSLTPIDAPGRAKALISLSAIR
jgi:hypothetical protein